MVKYFKPDARHFNSEAWRNDGTLSPPGWLSDALKAGTVFYSGGTTPHYTILTPHGEVRADWGEWIIMGDGELHVCGDQAFRRALAEFGLRLHLSGADHAA